LEKVTQEKDDWDEYLDGICLAYRTSVHSSTKATPYKLLYHQDPVLPYEVDINPNTTDDLLENQQYKTMEEVVNHINETASRNIKVAQQRYKKHFDKKHEQGRRTLSVGSKVLIKNMRNLNRKGSKMDPKFIGPYTISAVLSQNRVKLINPSGVKLKTVYSKSQLKTYCEREAKSKQIRKETASVAIPVQKKTASVNHPVKKKRASMGRKLKTPKKILTRSARKEEGVQHKPGIRSAKAAEPVSRNTDIQITGDEAFDHPFRPISLEEQHQLCRKLGMQRIRPVVYGRSQDIARPPKRLHRTRGDGNCFFRAISYCVTGTEDGHQTLRNKVTEHMSNKVSRELENYMNSNMSRYMDESNMILDGVWATDAEIIATASLLELDIMIYSSYGSIIEHNWQNFPSTFHLGQRTNKALYLQNLNNVHYDVVITTET